jgi:hypothetical protein
MNPQLQGWHPDPFGRHEARYFSAGRATPLVRDGVQEGSDPVDGLPLPVTAPMQPPTPVPAPPAPVGQPPFQPTWPAPPATPTPAPLPRWAFAVAGGLGAVLLIALGWFFLARGTQHNTPTAASQSSTGVAYTSAAGRFRATFPTHPVELAIPGSLSTMSFTLHIAACRTQHTEVASETTSQPVPSQAYDAVLQVAVRSFAASADLQTLGSKALRYQGHAAREATYSTRSGAHLSLLVMAYSPTRLYLISAPSGASFNSLTASFESLR